MNGAAPDDLRPVAVRFVTRKWAPAMGGMETYCLRLVDGLRQRANLDLIALPGRPDGSAPSPLALLKFGMTTFVRLLFGPPAAVVHIADMASWPLGLAARLRSAKTAIVLSAHGSDVSYGQRGGFKPWLYQMYLEMGAACLPHAHVIANSQWVAGLARDAGFRQISTVRMGCDIAPPDQPVPPNGALLFAGRISKGKGLRFLIEHVLPLLDKNTPLKVAGTLWDDEEAELLSRPDVHYLGALTPRDLAAEYAAASAVLVPSILPEGFGLVAAEAALCGGVVLAADHSGLAEALTAQTGFLLPSMDARAWAAKIMEIQGWNAARRDAYVAASKTAARQLGNWDRACDETAQIYGQLSQHR